MTHMENFSLTNNDPLHRPRQHHWTHHIIHLTYHDPRALGLVYEIIDDDDNTICLTLAACCARENSGKRIAYSLDALGRARGRTGRNLILGRGDTYRS